MKRFSPPALACWLLESALPPQPGEAMLGDLVEEYTLRADATSPSAASRWFWGQACRSLPPMAWCALRRGEWIVSLGVALGVYLAMGVLKMGTDLAILKLAAPGPTAQVVLAPIVFLTTTAIGGCLAARVRRGATILLALSVMITVVVLIDLKVCTMPVPWWYQFGFLALGPLAVLITPAVFGVGRPRMEEPVT